MEIIFFISVINIIYNSFIYLKGQLNLVTLVLSALTFLVVLISLYIEKKRPRKKQSLFRI